MKHEHEMLFCSARQVYEYLFLIESSYLSQYAVTFVMKGWITGHIHFTHKNSYCYQCCYHIMPIILVITDKSGILFSFETSGLVQHIVFSAEEWNLHNILFCI